MTSLQDLPPELRSTFILPVYLCQSVGLHIFVDADTTFLRKHGKFIVFDILFTLAIVLEVLYVLKSFDSDATFLDIANAIALLALCVLDLISCQVLAYKSNQIREVLLDIAEVWPANVTDNEEKGKIMENWLWRLKCFETTYLKIFVLSGSCIFLLGPLIYCLYNNFVTNQDPLYLFPMAMYFPFEINSTFRYLMAYFFQTISIGCLHVCTHVAGGLLLAVGIVDVSMSLRLLQFDLENVLESRSGVRVCDETGINKIVETHQKLIRVSEKLNDIYGVNNFFAFCLSSIILCFFGFCMTVTGFDIILVKYIIAFSGISTEFFNLSWPGQILFDTSAGVAEAAYRSLWYESDCLKFRKAILNIIVRSQRPSKLSALGFADMNLTTFSKILSTAWSYLTIVNQAYNKNN